MSFRTPGRRKSNNRTSRIESFQSGSIARPTLDSLLSTIVDGGLCATIILVPLIMGGRQALGRLSLTLCIGSATLAWLIQQCRRNHSRWTWSRVEWLLILGVGLVITQFITLPISFVQTLSPAQSELLSAWAPDLPLGGWKHISLTPRRSLDGLVMLINYALLFLLVVQRVETRHDAARLLRWIGVSGIVMSGFALLQFATSNGRFFWFYEHPFVGTSEVVKGAFTNRNHFAHFMALCLGPLVWWIAARGHSQRKNTRRSDQLFDDSQSRLAWLPLLGMLLVVFTGLMSLSRGGAVSLTVAGIVAVIGLYRAGWLELKLLFGLCLVGIALSALLLAFGGDSVDSRLDTIVSGDVEKLDRREGRRTIWRATWDGICDFPVLGTGVGSLREIYPVYTDGGGLQTEFTHAENGYLQVGMETGVLGFGLLTIGLLLCARWSLQVLRSGATGESVAIAGAATAGIVSSAVHSLGDFVWYVPGLVAVTVVMVAILCRMAQLVPGGEQSTHTFRSDVPRSRWIWGCVSVLPLLALMVGNRWTPIVAESHWHDYLRSVRFHSELTPSDSESSAQARTYADLKTLMKCVEADPTQSRSHAQLALLYAGVFDLLQQDSDNRMSMAQVRDTVESVGFENQEELDEWLQRAIGDNIELLRAAQHHATQAVALCPLRGEAYIHLAQLSFLVIDPDAEDSNYFEQALSVRPHAPFVLYHAGREAWLLGEYNEAVRHWKEAFHLDSYFQQRILDLLVDYVPAEFILDRFEPTWPALRVMVRRYEERPQDHKLVLQHLADASITFANQAEGGKRVKALVEGYYAFGKLGQHRDALRCLVDAVRTDHMAYEPRYEIGAWFYHRGQYDEALQHLQWCALQRPDDDSLQRLIDKAATERVRGANSGADVIAQEPIDSQLN